MSKEREYRIHCALEDLENAPLQPTAKKHAISRGSLRHRQKGGTNARDGQIKAQKLDPDQEQFLVNWILNEEAAGRGPTKKVVRGFAECILRHSGQDESIGHGWVNRFLARHDEVKMKPSRPVDAVRSRETTEEKISRFYRLLETQIRDKDIDRHNIHNVDEHGVAEGETKSGRVIGSSLSRFSIVSKSDSRTWVSIIESISAAGSQTTPVVIFTGENLQGQWFEIPWPDWKYECTPAGWSNALIFSKWFIEVFLPETKPRTSQWRLLILDGHSSHVTVEFMFLAWINKVQLLYLPAHSSHITQPLDVGIFAILKQFFHEETGKYNTLAARSPIQKRWFVKAYEIARMKAFTERNIRHAFRGAGIYPINANRPLEKVVNTTCPPSPKPLPTTPKKRKLPADGLLATPKNARDVKLRLEKVQKETGRIHRSLRTLVNQNAKLISHLTTLNANQEHEIEQLKKELESQKPTGRKVVDYDPNERFARIEEIAYAQYEAAKAPMRIRNRDAARLQDNSIRAAEMQQEGIMGQFQLQPN